MEIKKRYSKKPKAIIKRPWGQFKLLTKNKKSTTKLLEVKSGQELSLQKHKKRKEIWYFINPGKVQINEDVFNVKAGELIEIPKKTSHRIIAPKNKNKKSVQVLEISLGSFNEKDEIRIEDKYGRK